MRCSEALKEEINKIMTDLDWHFGIVIVDCPDEYEPADIAAEMVDRMTAGEDEVFWIIKACAAEVVSTYMMDDHCTAADFRSGP